MRYMGEGGIRMKEHGVSSYRRFLRGETDGLENLIVTYSDELVRFASACSGVAISRFPLPLNPPTLEDVEKLIRLAE